MKVCIYIAMFFFFSACAQEQQANWALHPPITHSNAVEIDSNNFVEALSSYVKRYPIEPYYYVFVNNEGCFYEILINDVPAERYFKDGKMATPINLNYYINKSGKQTLTYRLYPQTKREDGFNMDKLPAWTKIGIELYVRDNADLHNAFDSEKEVLQHTSLTQADGKTFVAAGETYYEYTLSFDAEVPYQGKGWEDSKKKKKMDPDTLLEKTVSAYQYFWHIIDSKDSTLEFNLSLNNYVSQIVNHYQTKEDLYKIHSAIQFVYQEPTFKMEPLQDYKLKLYGHGRIVCLEIESEILYLKHYWPIYGLYNNGARGRFLRLYLHIPQGKTTFEIIR